MYIYVWGGKGEEIFLSLKIKINEIGHNVKNI